MKRQFLLNRRALPLAAFALASAAAGCFNEPEPAYKSVPPENRVYLSGRGLEEVPSVNPGADYLNLDRNQLTNAAAVAALAGLKWLRLNDNRLAALPDLGKLTKLRRIYLRNNRFTAVPETLKDLPSLTDIDLSGNPIEEVPVWLAEKEGLKNLSFSRTRLKALPAKLDAWRSLQSLQLGELRLSAEEMKRIRDALPGVALVF
ncbi:MAG: leucine-rich repeat domain-containing protein [Kiritimatiellae bacterium]|nr:leucine-rich repeat domain-containing protein [Kiritimatiellia bacterium]